MPERNLKLGRDLRRAPEKVEETLGLLEGRVEEAAHVFEGARCALFLGRGPSYPVALEGAGSRRFLPPSRGLPGW